MIPTSYYDNNKRRRASNGVNTAASGLLEISQMNYGHGELGESLELYQYQTTEREALQMEEELCSDFTCCGLPLPDLHALLQHYEESHVRMEDELNLQNGRYLEVMEKDRLSAFDTTVFRTVTPAQAYHLQLQQQQTCQQLPNRPKSVPVNLGADPDVINTLRAMLPSVVANVPGDTSFKLIHTALSSTINPLKSTEKEDDASPTWGERRPRPYTCKVEGCGKTYKNPNGLKYHVLHGHGRESKESCERPHRCPFLPCSKRYKNANGLKYHVQHAHSPGALGAFNTLSTSPKELETGSLKSIASLNQIEAALKRERALRAQLAYQNLNKG